MKIIFKIKFAVTTALDSYSGKYYTSGLPRTGPLRPNNVEYLFRGFQCQTVEHSTQKCSAGPQAGHVGVEEILRLFFRLLCLSPVLNYCSSFLFVANNTWREHSSSTPHLQRSAHISFRYRRRQRLFFRRMYATTALRGRCAISSQVASSLSYPY